jgi:hypothetical protein
MMRPRPQFTIEAAQPQAAIMAAAWAVVRGREARASRARFTGPLAARACPVTRMRHICIEKASIFQRPSAPRQPSRSAVKCAPGPALPASVGKSPRRRARAAARRERSTAMAKGSGMSRANQRLMVSPRVLIIRAEYRARVAATRGRAALPCRKQGAGAAPARS